MGPLKLILIIKAPIVEPLWSLIKGIWDIIQGSRGSGKDPALKSLERGSFKA